MHKVCNIRDLDLRSRLPPERKWASYRADLEKLLERSIEGGFANINVITDSTKNVA